MSGTADSCGQCDETALDAIVEKTAEAEHRRGGDEERQQGAVDRAGTGHEYARAVPAARCNGVNVECHAPPLFAAGAHAAPCFLTSGRHDATDGASGCCVTARS